MKKILFLLLFTAISFAQTKTINRTGEKTILNKTSVGLPNVDNTSDVSKPISTAAQTALNAKASIISPTFTGTVSGITKSMVGLPNVDNTSDIGKPISTAAQTALNAKASLASPTFTGTVSGVTATMVGLPNVDNTTDLLKPVSTATTTAISTASILDRARANHTGTQDASTVLSSMNYDGSIIVPSKDMSIITTNLYTDVNTKIGLKADKLLAGIVVTNSSDVIGTDNVLVGIGKLQAQSTLISAQIPQSASICNSFYVSPDTGLTTSTSDAGYVAERIFFAYGDIDNTAGNITLNPLTGVMTAVTAGTYKINIRVMFVYAASTYIAILKNITTSATIAAATHKYSSLGFGNCREISIEAKATFLAGAKISLEQPGGWGTSNYNRMLNITDPIIKDLMARQYMYISFTKL